MAIDGRERAFADSQFGSGATSYSPATWYWGLSTTVPNEDGSNFTEPVGGSYARVAMNNTSTNFPAATTTAGVTTKTNGAKITWPNPTGTWGLILYWGIFLTNGATVPEYVGPMDSPITPKAGNTPVELDIGAWSTVWE